MSTHPSLALPALGTRCRCEHPLVDADTCIRCGRFPTVAPRPAVPVAGQRSAWTRAGAIRVVRAFTFFRGRPPAPSDWAVPMGPDWPPLEVVQELFGSLETLLRASRSDV
jgi:hypothetical protein